MPAAGKVTVVLALHWPCNGLSTYVTGSRPKEGRYAPRLHSLLGMAHFTIILHPFWASACPQHWQQNAFS